MATSYPMMTVSQGWVDLCAENATLIDKKIMIQNRSNGEIWIYFGGATEPTSANDGIELRSGEALEGTSDHIWARGSGVIALLENDA